VDGIGIVAGWMTVLLGLSYYARGRIGVQRWRRLHRFTALAWLLALAHSLGAGTDAGTAWFLVALGIVVVPALTLLIARLTEEAPAPAPPTAAGVPPPAREPEPLRPVSAPRLWSRA
jgi:sulfoxide reductase heme-binding subunit YedZ